MLNPGKVANELMATTAYSHHGPRTLKCKRLHHAIVQPCYWEDTLRQLCGGVTDEHGVFQDNSGFHDFFQVKGTYNTNDAIQRNETAIYLGCFIQVWGHVFTDCFAKLWYLTTAEGQKLIHNNVRLIYLTTDGQPLKPYFKEMFALAGIDIDSCEHISQLSCFDTLMLPDNSFYIKQRGGGRYFTNEYVQLIANIHDQVSKARGTFPEKIYFTRTHYIGGKQDYGERAIEQCFRQAGFTIVVPEKLTVIQQVELVAHCNIYASTEGSISHNCIFCRKGATVIILKKGHYVNGYQTAINDVRSLHVIYFDVGLSCFNDRTEPWQGPFFIRPTTQLQVFLGLQSKTVPLLLNIDWYRYLLFCNPVTRRLRKTIHTLLRFLR